MSDRYNGEPLPEGWLVFRTDDGRPYFHNKNTAATQWEIPRSSASLSTLTVEGSGRREGSVSLSTPSRNSSTAYPGLSAYAESHPMSGDGEITFMSGYVKGGKGYTSLSTTASKPESPLGNIDLEGGGVSNDVLTGSTRASVGSTADRNTFWCPCVDLKPLERAFDVDTVTVTQRVVAALLPNRAAQAPRDYTVPPASGASSSSSTATPSSSHFSGALGNTAGPLTLKSQPDLYGPFWVPTTLITILFALHQLSAYLYQTVPATNYRSFALATTLVYGYWAVIPALAWTLILFLGAGSTQITISVKELVAVYGYAFSTGIPLAFLSLIPYVLLRWLLAVLGICHSLVFLFYSFRRDLPALPAQLKLVLFCLFLGSQVSFYAWYPLYFFSLVP